ncbi:MAG: beta-lactamase family protein [Acidobacteria bacterium]|nr:beta-lactamase family protein [Acidobacteriota bacterium]
MAFRALPSLLACGLAVFAGEPVDELFARHFAPDQPGVAALLRTNGKVQVRKAYGMASLELGVAMRPDHVFRIGSITKTFVAVVVLQLVEEGKLALDSPISAYLKDAPKAWEKVTVAHLLSHTSGITDYLSGPQGGYGALRTKRLSLDQLINTFRSWPLQFEPGSAFRYSNSGYLLLGQLIVAATGRAFPQELAARITGPLGLRHTSGGDPDALTPGLVTGYTNGAHPAFIAYLDGAYTDGCMTSTVDDLAAFAEALHGGKLLKPETYRRMTTPFRTANGHATEYGFGLFIRTSNGHILYGHGGDIFGFHGELEADPEARAVAVVLHNGDQFGAHRTVAAEYLSRRMLALAQGKPLLEPAAVALGPEHLAPLAGTYVGPSGQRVLSLEGGRLVSRHNGGEPVALEAASPTTFFLPGQEMRLRFTLEQGRATAVQRYEDGGEADPVALRVD